MTKFIENTYHQCFGLNKIIKVFMYLKFPESNFNIISHKFPLKMAVKQNINVVASKCHTDNSIISTQKSFLKIFYPLFTGITLKYLNLLQILHASKVTRWCIKIALKMFKVKNITCFFTEQNHFAGHMEVKRVQNFISTAGSFENTEIPSKR